MKTAMIVPHSCLYMTRGLDYHMILPQIMLGNEAYHKFYKEVATGYKIVDNGAAEGDRCSDEDLFWAAREVDANCIVIPDEMGHAQETIELVRQFGEQGQDEEYIYDYMAVIQGKSYSDIVRCLDFYDTQPWITAIALPRLLCNTVHRDVRISFATAFESFIKGRFKFVHCLGASHSVEEVKELKNIPIIQGIDTSLPATLGIEGIKMDDAPYVSRQMDFFDRDLTTAQKTMIQYNIDTYNKWGRK